MAILKNSNVNLELEEVPGQHKHFVQFYETDAFLLDSVSAFMGTGLSAGYACIIIATQPHREGIEAQLKASGLDIVAASKQDQYISLDAKETLSQFIVDGEIVPARFTEVIGNIIERAAKGGRQIRIFGEMVALLWVEGNQTAAIRLEELWNDINTPIRPFSLFCAYSTHNVAGEENRKHFLDVCQRHTHIIPDENYTLLSSADERLRAITLLQQKAASLESEIAHRKASEERIRISENRYRRLFEASSDGILIIDPLTGRISDANPAISNLLDYPYKQVLGKTLCDIGLFADQETTHTFLQNIHEQHTLQHEISLNRKGQQTHYIEFTSMLYQEEGREVIQCNLRDISERKGLDKRKDEFIGIASHELKTPVTSLKGFLGLLQRRLTTQEDEKGLHYLARMNLQINKLTRLINDLLDISKMEAGQIAYRKELFMLDELIQEIVEDVQETTQTHQIQFEGKTKLPFFGDHDRIGQVLINLLSNAIKYSPEANTVLVRLTIEDNQVHIGVQDFGIGIASEFQPKVFERFYQVTDSEDKTSPGLGLGLYISCEIVKRHNGYLWVESEKRKGSTFHVNLPLVEEGKQ